MHCQVPVLLLLQLLLLMIMQLLLLHLLHCPAPVVVDRHRLDLAQPNHTALRRRLRVASLLRIRVPTQIFCGLTRVRFLVERQSEQRKAQPQQDERRDGYASARIVLHACLGCPRLLCTAAFQRGTCCVELFKVYDGGSLIF